MSDEHYGIDFGGRKITFSSYNGINCKIVENVFSEKYTMYFYNYYFSTCIVWDNRSFKIGKSALSVVYFVLFYFIVC